jgi:hypothetical protein
MNIDDDKHQKVHSQRSNRKCGINSDIGKGPIGDLILEDTPKSPGAISLKVSERPPFLTTQTLQLFVPGMGGGTVDITSISGSWVQIKFHAAFGPYAAGDNPWIHASMGLWKR